MRTPLPLRIISNSWLYYLVKYGLLSKATLKFRTKPDVLGLELTADVLRVQWDHVKHLLKLISANEFEYYAAQNEMVVFSARGEKRREGFDFSCISTLRYAMDNDINLEHAPDNRFFIASISGGGISFLFARRMQQIYQRLKVFVRKASMNFFIHI